MTCNIYPMNMRVYQGSLTSAHYNFPSVPLVPEAEVNTGILNDSYRESQVSDIFAK
jgi:hypothetical protein